MGWVWSQPLLLLYVWPFGQLGLKAEMEGGSWGGVEGGGWLTGGCSCSTGTRGCGRHTCTYTCTHTHTHVDAETAAWHREVQGLEQLEGLCGYGYTFVVPIPHTCTHAHTFIYTCIHIHTPRMAVWLSIRLCGAHHTHTHTHTQKHTHTYTYTCTHKHAYIHTYTHTYTHIHTYNRRRT